MFYRIVLALSILITGSSYANEQQLIDSVLNSKRLEEEITQSKKLINSRHDDIVNADNSQLQTLINTRKQQITGKTFSNYKKPEQKNNLIIFISLSLPDDSLKNYYLEARRYNAVLAIRGFINDSLKDTVAYFKKSGEEGIAVTVDPESFRKFNVTNAPAIIVKDPNSDIYDKVTGNVTVNYALQKIADQGDLKDQANNILQGGNL